MPLLRPISAPTFVTYKPEAEAEVAEVLRTIRIERSRTDYGIA